MTHHLDALGWTLIHFCWQAAAIAIAYRVVDAAASRARSHVRYALALGALLGMLAASLGTMAYEETRGADVGNWLSISGSTSHTISAGLAIVTPGKTSEPGAIAPMQAAPPSAASASPFQPTEVIVWLDMLWLLGVVTLSLRTLGGWWMIYRLRQTGLMKAPDAVESALRRLCERTQFRRRVDIFLCERISGPIAVGVFRSLILLPVSTLAALSPEQLESVIAHELAHVRRADYLWNILQTMIETVFFFHPAVWWMSRNVRQQRELCCDDIAVRSCADPVVYASALLKLEEQRRMHLHLAMALDGNQPQSSFRARVGRILGEVPLRRRQRDLAPASLLGVCTALALFLMPVPQVYAILNKPEVAIPTLHPAVARPSLELPEAAKCVKVGRRAIAPAPIVNSIVAAPLPEALENASPHAMIMQRLQASVKSAPRTYTVASLGSAGSFMMATVDGQDAQVGTQKRDYIDAMKAAGYDVDLDKYVAMKVQGITPEYAEAMAKAGFGKPSADELVSLKVQGVNPETVREMRAAGLEPGSFNDLVTYKIFNVSPEFIASVKKAGFASVPPKKLVEMRVHGIDAEYIQSVKQQFPEASMDDLVQMKIFNIDDKFVASARRHGFTPLTIQKLVKLRISGVLNDEQGD